MNGKKLNIGRRDLVFLLLVILMIGLTIGSAIADPVGTGTLTSGSTSRGTNPLAGNLTIEGGNVTSLGTITHQGVTAKWAGFYGDVQGSVTLETGGGAVFYNWTNANPDGEVFATRDNNPTWGSIICAGSAEVSAESTALSLGSGIDNITNTFCTTCGNHSAFNVGATPFTADECTYRTNVYNSSGSQTANWDQVMLYEGSNVVYTTIINQDTTGFDGSAYDFQLLVAEDSNTTQLTTYYFFVEI